RGGVDGAGALLGGGVVGEDCEDGAVEEGVGEGGALEFGAFEAGDCGGGFHVADFVACVAGGCGELACNDIDVLAVVERDVFNFWIEGDGHGSWEGPGRGRPDDGVDFAACELGVDL